MICAVINRRDEIRKIKVTIFTVGEYSTQRGGGDILMVTNKI